MSSRLALLPLLLLLGLGSAGQGNTAGVSDTALSHVAARLTALLPLDDVQAQIIKLGSQIATLNLQQKVTTVGGSPAALKTVLASAARGQIPSYDARLGITREEFGRYLAFQPVLLHTGKTLKIMLVRTAQRVTLLDHPSNPAVLRGLSFDLRTGEVEVPEGFKFWPSALPASAAKDRSIDLRGGVQWNMRGYDPISQNGIRGQLSLYQLGSGQVLLSYDRTNMLRGIPGERAELLVTYTR